MKWDRTSVRKASCPIITAATIAGRAGRSTRTAISRRSGCQAGNVGVYIYPLMPATTNAVKNVDVYKTPAME